MKDNKSKNIKDINNHYFAVDLVFYGSGSEKKIPGSLKGEVPVQTRFRQRKGLGD